jgi:TPR repeat protein
MSDSTPLYSITLNLLLLPPHQRDEPNFLALLLLIFEGDYTALTELISLAESSPIARLYLSLLYSFGSKIISPNPLKASEYHDHISHFFQSNPTASPRISSCEILYLQSICSEYGLGLPINKLKSFSSLKAAAATISAIHIPQAGEANPSSLLLASLFCDLGYFFLFGIKTKSSSSKLASDYFMKGFSLSSISDHDHDHTTTTTTTTAALLNNLGFCYLYGYGVEKDSKKAYELYLQGALHGDINCQHNVGYCLQYHLLDHDEDDSHHTIQEGEQLSSTFSSYSSSAIYWYQLAADAGSSYGQFRLGYCYQHGLEGLTTNLTTAIHFYTLSANQQNSFGQYFLASCHQHLLVPPPSPSHGHHHTRAMQQESELKAYGLYLDSACQGNPYGLHGLAQCYQHGIGVERNLNEAQRIYSLFSSSAPLPSLLSPSSITADPTIHASSTNPKFGHHPLISSGPHHYYHEHLICHLSYQTISTTLPFSHSSHYSLLNTHNPHHLFEVVCQFGYQPYYSLLTEYSQRGCNLSSAYLLCILYQNFFEFLPPANDEKHSLDYQQRCQQIPSILSELSSWMTLLAEEEGEGEAKEEGHGGQHLPLSLTAWSSPSNHKVLYLISFLSTLQKHPAPRLDSFLSAFHPDLPSHGDGRIPFSTLSTHTLQPFTSFPPALHDFHLPLFFASSPASSQSPPPPDLHALGQSTYLPSRYLIACCHLYGFYGFEKNITLANESFTLCLSYGMRSDYHPKSVANDSEGVQTAKKK